MPDRSSSAPASAGDSRVVPIVEERAFVLKRRTPTEGLRVRTVVREERTAIDEPVARETVDVERRPLDRWVDGPVPARQEGDTIIVTLLEEVVVVEKRLRATEEVRITRRRHVDVSSHAIMLRREEAVIERVTAASGGERDAG